MTMTMEASARGADGSSLKGWPYTDFATGWYQIGYSSDFKPGDIQPAKWLNQDLVVFRTESGRMAVLDAYCPHMGAHLGHVGKFGGRICGENIACPWHGWEWTADGANAAIPYEDGHTVKARIRTHHAREIDGMIFLWYDSKGEAPTYEYPGIPYVGDKSDYYDLEWQLDGPHRVKPQQPFENSADPHHFPHVHGSALDAEFSDFFVEGPLVRNEMAMLFGGDRDSTWLTPDGPVMGKVENFCWGVALGVARFRIGDMVCIHCVYLTPVDHDNCMFFSTTTHSKNPRDTASKASGVAKKMMDAQQIQIRHDFHIWGNMVYLVRPIYTGSDERTRYAFLRKHFDQFYPNPVYKRAE